MSTSCACKGCQKRFVGCHASCEDYKKFKEGLKKQNDLIYRKKQKQIDIDGFFFGGPGKITHQR